MASGMQDIKRRIKSVTSIEHVTNAMKLVSAAKLRRAKLNFEKTNEFSDFIINSIAEVFNNTEEVPEKYLLRDNEIENTCYIIVTSGRGFCGSFNSNIIKEAEAAIKKETGSSMILAIGSKGRDYFGKHGYNIYDEYSAPPEDISFLENQEITRPIIDMYNEGTIDKIVLIYTAFVSTLEQQVQSITLLPFEIERDPEIIRHEKEVEYEPSVEGVFNYLVPKYVETSIHAALVESAMCEHAARRMAMENATDNARDMLSDLSLHYNRARQSLITDEIIEIVAGSEAQQ